MTLSISMEIFFFLNVIIIVLISYYRLICWDMLSCPGEVEEHEQRPWQVSLNMVNMVMVNMVMVNTVMVNMVMVNMVMVNMVSLKMEMMGMVNMVFWW